MFYKIKIYNRAGPDRHCGPRQRPEPGTIKQVVLQVGPLGTTHLTIYSHSLRLALVVTF
jgi:hypothetical protein